MTKPNHTQVDEVKMLKAGDIFPKQKKISRLPTVYQSPISIYYKCIGCGYTDLKSNMQNGKCGQCGTMLLY